MAVGTGAIFGLGVGALLLAGLASSAKAGTSVPNNPPPARTTKQYTVVAGDTMVGIATKCTGVGSRYTELFAVNPGKATTTEWYDSATGKYYFQDSAPASGDTGGSTSPDLTTGAADIGGMTAPVGGTFLGAIVNQGKVWKSLVAGEVINVPADWGCGS